mgnify:CR=1 FL=1
MPKSRHRNKNRAKRLKKYKDAKAHQYSQFKDEWVKKHKKRMMFRQKNLMESAREADNNKGLIKKFFSKKGEEK